MSTINLTNNYPQTIEEAIKRIKTIFPDEILRDLSHSTEKELVMFHFGLGTSIRNELGLSSGDNEALLEDCGAKNPDQASGFLIYMLWKELQTNE